MKNVICSSVIYRGPSLIDGSPIVVVAVITKSDDAANGKTGAVVQTYILRADMDPRDASKSGADFSICGNCPHRGIATDDPKPKLAKKRTCYVVIGQGPLIVYRAMLRGNYPDAFDHDSIAAIGAGQVVRLGTYGDPAAVPSHVWDSLLTNADSHLGYTHQSGFAGADVRNDLCMTSADTEQQARDAWARGERTFRIIASTADMVKGQEALCPASKEGGYKTTCNSCKLCGGTSVNARSIAIVAHGSGAKYFGEVA